MGTREVLRPYCRGQAISHTIRVAEHFILSIERHYRHNRAEDLFLIGPAVVRQSFDYRRLDEPSIRTTSIEQSLLAPGKDLSAFLPGEHDVRHYLFEMLFRDDRSD